jgi:hypothetical protein
VLGEAVCVGFGCHAAPAGGEVAPYELYVTASADRSQRDRATFSETEVLEFVSSHNPPVALAIG